MRFRFASPLAAICLSALALHVMAETSLAPANAAENKGEKPVYQPQGAPANPRVAAQWNRYHDYAQVTELLKQLAAAHADFCTLQSLGQSYGKREMWLLTVTNKQRGKELDKPAFWIDAAIHANEIQASEVALYTAWYLLESQGRAELVDRLLDERVFYIVPMMSPDSRDAHMYDANSTHSPRTGQRPRDDDRDGLVDEDKSDDLDGDGHLTQMRIRDPHGRWKKHPDYPNLMIEAKPDETGEFTLLGTEGFDNDGDGRVDEDAEGYYDPNRNWPWNWQPPYVQTGADRYPFSIEENRLVADFVMAHPNIAGAQSYHNAGGMILRGPGAKSETYDAADVAVFTEIGKKGETMLPGYRYLQTGVDLYEVFGGAHDWLYSMNGAYSFVNELFTGHNFFRQKSDGLFGKNDDQQLFNKYLLLGDGIVPWHEVQHPQFGKIEVGGFKKNWIRQPPSFLLEEECHRNMAFTLYHADQMPLVAVESVNVSQLSPGLFTVNATIANRRLCPTHAAVDVKHKLTPPDLVSISGEGIKVIAGLTADNLLFEHPQEQKRRPAVLRVPTIPGHKAIYARWIVAGQPPFKVTVKSPKGGVAEK